MSFVDYGAKKTLQKNSESSSHRSGFGSGFSTGSSGFGSSFSPGYSFGSSTRQSSKVQTSFGKAKNVPKECSPSASPSQPNSPGPGHNKEFEQRVEDFMKKTEKLIKEQDETIKQQQETIRRLEDVIYGSHKKKNNNHKTSFTENDKVKNLNSKFYNHNLKQILSQCEPDSNIISDTDNDNKVDIQLNGIAKHILLNRCDKTVDFSLIKFIEWSCFTYQQKESIQSSLQQLLNGASVNQVFQLISRTNCAFSLDQDTLQTMMNIYLIADACDWEIIASDLFARLYSRVDTQNIIEILYCFTAFNYYHQDILPVRSESLIRKWISSIVSPDSRCYRETCRKVSKRWDNSSSSSKMMRLAALDLCNEEHTSSDFNLELEKYPSYEKKISEQKKQNQQKAFPFGRSKLGGRFREQSKSEKLEKEEKEKENQARKQSALDGLIGEVISRTLDYLSKELVRDQEVQNIRKMMSEAKETRRKREAEEMGRRQKEEQKRSRIDEYYQQVSRVNQEQAEYYVDDIMAQTVEEYSHKEAMKETREYAEDRTQRSSEQTEVEQVRDLVSQFLLPQVDREMVKRKVDIEQQKYLKAAHDALNQNDLNLKDE
eukprot:gb/GECH01002750.1/.p1 GENE.gb/GECH01002750.1/~~gb/GECH01002750.1/.p1  ORF type:complete len:600 (+),score=162.46 gb/GECH01002750.1/:1-1800(+)